uniref:Regulatory protein viviparous-1 isoform X2 n=1 Tax=Elaeis guineensis var. tenera TaxID=51953 RepID=A0A6I9RI22_ELAGV|nr:regulatory protein viviparous-1 isoform X2 [Elaeis guineensis]
MEPDGDHLHQQQHAEAAEEAMAMAAAAATVATSPAGAADNKDKGKRIWIPDEGPSNPPDDLMLDIEGDDLIFSDAAFSCLPDFPCLPSPARSPSSSSACNLFHNTSLASSSSSSSSFLFGSDGGGSGGGDLQAVASSSNGERMMPSEVASDLLSMELEGLDILGDMGLFDLSEQWNPASLFPDSMTMNGEATASTSGPGPSPPLHAMAGEVRPPGEAGVGGGAARGAPVGGPEEDPEEMARVFFEWMRINRDAISPQDLREIRMKRATIDCAVRHLGGNRQAQVQLLKLVLTWVQANHLQKKKRRRSQNEHQDRPERAAQPPYPYHHQHQQQPFASPNHHLPVMSSDVPVNPNPNLDYSYNADSQRHGWNIPYHVDPTTGVAFPVMMPVYGGGGGSSSGGEPAYPGPAAAANYSYHQGGTSGIVLNGQPFSPSPDMHAADHTAAAWPSQYAAAPAQYVPFGGAAGPHPATMPQAQYPGGFVNQYPGHALYQQGQRLGGMASVTKEARKKRMARQRRVSSLHSHRSQPQQQQQQNHHQAESSSSRAPAEGASSSSSNANNNNNNNNNNNHNNNNNNRTWSFWSSSSSSRQKNPMVETPPPPKSSMQQPQLSPSMPPQQQNSHRDAASSTDRRQGLKGEKNLRFLFQKVLKQSDVGSLGRIVLPKKEAEIHLPELEARDGISIPVEDIGTSQVWNMRFWPNNKSRMYLLENTGEFVRSNGLQEGDFIIIYSDMKCGKYMIRGIKVRPQPERGRANRSVARSHLKRSSWERGSTSRMRGSSSHDGINDDPGMPSSSAASPFMIKMEASP